MTQQAKTPRNRSNNGRTAAVARTNASRAATQRSRAAGRTYERHTTDHTTHGTRPGRATRPAPQRSTTGAGTRTSVRAAAGRTTTRQTVRAAATTSPSALRTNSRNSQGNRNSRLGSKQQVSIRGRRIAPIQQDNNRLLKSVVLPACLFLVGVICVMWLSGLTTAQSFQLTEAKQTSRTLANEITSLERDLAVASSSANIAKEAARLGMVAPAQAGVLEAAGAEIHEQRPANPEGNVAVVDVNSESRARGATSNPNETANVAGLAPQQAVIAEQAGVATANSASANATIPYADRQAPPAPVESAPAPSDAAPAPVDAVPAPDNADPAATPQP